MLLSTQKGAVLEVHSDDMVRHEVIHTTTSHNTHTHTHTHTHVTQRVSPKVQCSAYMVGDIVEARQLLAELVCEVSSGGLTGDQSEGQELLMLWVTGPAH